MEAAAEELREILPDLGLAVADEEVLYTVPKGSRVTGQVQILVLRPPDTPLGVRITTSWSDEYEGGRMGIWPFQKEAIERVRFVVEIYEHSVLITPEVQEKPPVGDFPWQKCKFSDGAESRRDDLLLELRHRGWPKSRKGWQK